MIKLLMVQGDVIIDDLRGQYSQMGTMGLELPSSGDILIATTSNSHATILLNGKTITLGHSSFLRVRGDRSWWDRHQALWSRDVRLFLGRIWAKIDKDPRELDSYNSNAIVGVRG